MGVVQRKQNELSGSSSTSGNESRNVMEKEMSFKKEKLVTISSQSAIPYLLGYIPSILVVMGAFLGGWWNYFTFFFAFGIIPTLDLIIGLDDYNPTKEEAKILDKQISFRLVTWFWLPHQVALLIWSCWFISTHDVSMFEWFGVAIGTGIVGGLGINCAHELIHKPNTFEQTLGRMILVTVSYGHFYIEHLWGHHKRVSTPIDPATALYDEHFYSFWVRCVRDSFLDAWKIEKKRLEKEKLPLYSIYNQMLQFIFASCFIAYILGLRFGLQATLFFCVQSFFAFSLLEVVNYIEHYGLMRKEKENGEYVKVTPGHSWNAGHRITNYFLFKLQRHSDHHAYAGRRYQILRSWKASPQMPTGYAGMILTALCPPLWFRIMNPRVEEVRKQQEEWERLGKDAFVDPSIYQYVHTLAV